MFWARIADSTAKRPTDIFTCHWVSYKTYFTSCMNLTSLNATAGDKVVSAMFAQTGKHTNDQTNTQHIRTCVSKITTYAHFCGENDNILALCNGNHKQ